jgi:flagellar basal-body rod protein FlgF
MDSGFYSAFTGLAARMQSLDLVANNMANANTTGFKAQKEFYSALTTSLNNQRLTPVNQAINDFGLLGGSRTDFSAGSLEPTGNDTDLAIDGSGFFVVKTKSGAERYTRNGNFSLNTQRQLVDSEGNFLQGTDGPIQLPAGKVTISPDGTVSVDGAIVSTIKIVDFPASTQLKLEGNTEFSAPTGAAKPAPEAQLQEGMLEASNSNPVMSAVTLMDLQRNAEMMQRALSIFNNDFNQTATEQLAKV